MIKITNEQYCRMIIIRHEVDSINSALNFIPDDQMNSKARAHLCDIRFRISQEARRIHEKGIWASENELRDILEERLPTANSVFIEK